jgi:predicted lipoprotein
VRAAALLLAGSLLAGAGAVRAQAVAVPFYSAQHWVDGLYRHGLAPDAAAFAARAAALPAAVGARCDAAGAAAASALDQARAQWRDAMLAWEALAALPIGPLIERRALRTLDFTPARPALIARAIEAQPADAAAMERIGAPAKGLPALEWLLWTSPVAPGSPACSYAVQVAEDLAREAQALALAAAAEAPHDENRLAAATAEAVNQLVGAVERLRWAQIEKPARGGAEFPRTASGATAHSWQAQWQAIRARLRMMPASAPPVPGTGLLPVETWLRGRGQLAEADALAAAVDAADASLRGLTPAAGARLSAAAQALAGVKQVLENRVAPALQVRIGFSDADGD